jgi:acetate kinase
MKGSNVENRFDTLDGKVDKIQEDISDIKVIMAVNTKSLEQHMLRTEQNEEMIKLMQQEFKPVQEHIIQVNTIAKVGAWVVGLLSAVYYLFDIISFFVK